MCSLINQVSYNAAGVLAHIASDGPEAWTIDTPTRDYALARMSAAIDRWNLNVERNINYRSFEPILGLVRCYETPECQHWAVWALANLTSVRNRYDWMQIQIFTNQFQSRLQVYPLKYCRLVEEERGIELLNELLAHEKPNERIKELTRIVIRNCRSNGNNEMMQLDG